MYADMKHRMFFFSTLTGLHIPAIDVLSPSMHNKQILLNPQSHVTKIHIWEAMQRPQNRTAVLNTKLRISSRMLTMTSLVATRSVQVIIVSRLFCSGSITSGCYRGP